MVERSDVDEYDFLSNDESHYVRYCEDLQEDKKTAHGKNQLDNNFRNNIREQMQRGTPKGRGVQYKNKKRADYDDIDDESPDRDQPIGLHDILVKPLESQ